MAARRTRLPETATDWMGSLRDMKEGWVNWRRRGGGGGRGCHLDVMGSKVKKLIVVRERLDGCEQRA